MKTRGKEKGEARAARERASNANAVSANKIELRARTARYGRGETIDSTFKRSSV